MENIKDFRQMVKITGIIGILTFLTVPITMILYFMYSGVPPIWNVLLRTLVALFSLLFELIFFTGFQQIIKKITKENNWLIILMYNTVCVCIAINFVAHSLEAGGVLNPEGVAIDATQDGLLAQGNYLLYGSISRLLMATYMGIIGIITFKTRIFPKWTGWMAIIIGIINLIFVPSMFYGTNAGDFYSAVGWGNSAVAASLFTWWILAISIILIKNKNEL
ncbi:MAG: hypothetical protein LBK25_01215 [Treponema sp.]|jgi:hypothetical protein|nr:hypothetical protein [Treponema sp.]